jgi:hypothetical protein
MQLMEAQQAQLGPVGTKILEFKSCKTNTLSPRDLWSCVLPRWQFNVNVKTNTL